MFAILIYDIPSDVDGTKRRNKLYKICKSKGYHVQNSVFEFDMDYASVLKLKELIKDIIDPLNDSVRIYYLGKKRTETNVELIGKRELIESNDDTFVL